MGNVLMRILQRAVPALKEHQNTIEILQNQNLIKDQEIIHLHAQKDLIEQHVVQLSSELASTNIKIEELKVNSKRLLMVGAKRVANVRDQASCIAISYSHSL